MTVVETILVGAVSPVAIEMLFGAAVPVAGLASAGGIHRLGLAKLGGRLVERVHGCNVCPVGDQVKWNSYPAAALMAAIRAFRTFGKSLKSRSSWNGAGSEDDEVMKTRGFHSWSAAMMYPTLASPYSRSWIKCWLEMVCASRGPVTLSKFALRPSQWIPSAFSTVAKHSLSWLCRANRFCANLISSGEGIYDC